MNSRFEGTEEITLIDIIDTLNMAETKGAKGEEYIQLSKPLIDDIIEALIDELHRPAITQDEYLELITA
jgi:hypothetical protein